MTTELPFTEAVRSRRSIRGFLDQPVPGSVMRAVLEDAQYAPSNCNTQPWNTHVVQGEKLQQLSRLLHAKNDASEFTPDFSFDVNDFHGQYRERKSRQWLAPLTIWR
jgi:nitroreductase